MSPDVHALTGAYVLDAVSELERAAFERHIAECDACAQEVRELRGTAARLGQAVAGEPPARLKSQVLAKISEVRQVPREIEPSSLTARAQRNRLALRLTTVAAAVLLVATAVLGVLLVQVNSSREDTRQFADSIATVLNAGDVRFTTAQGKDGGTVNILTSRSKDKVLVFTTGMPPAPAGKTYQAWLSDPSGTMHSVGLVPNADSARLALPLGTSQGFGLSVENAGGAEEPTADAVVMQVGFPGA
jgi:anti-sigma-K factor RskA